MKCYYIRRNIIFSLMLTLTACVSIPSEAPGLSVELGKRISAIEDSNITLLHRFFDQKRKEVDGFIENEWVPEFANNFFSNPKISAIWDEIVRNDDKSERLTFIIKSGPKLQAMINKKRLELIQPLDDLERRIEKGIRDEYSQARAMNNSITSFLFSASEVAENRNRYLEMAGVTDNKIGSLLDKTDDAVSALLKGAEKIQDKEGKGEKYLNKIRSIKDSI